MNAFDLLYPRLPLLAQHAAFSAYGLYWHWLRFGPGYADAVREYRQRERYSSQQWQDWQAAQLKYLLPAAAKYVSHYRDHWGEDQRRAAMQGDLSSLPLLEKEPLRLAPRSFLREDLHPSKLQVFPTSGSTGTPISAWYTLSELRRSLALREVRSAGWAGVSYSLPRATFSGRMIVSPPDSQGPFYRFNLAEKQVYFSAFHLRPDTAQKYIAALHRHGIQWATGYAVSFYLLACFMLQEKILPPGLRAIITTSEKLTAEMRDVIQQAFGCRVFEEYGTVENAVFASECERGHLHLSPDVSVTEILRTDGSPCALGEIGEIVVTTLSRTYQPLIRFRLGDLAAWAPAPCECGRQMPVLQEVVGRVEDILVSPDGRKMIHFYGIFKNQPHVREGQIIQEALDRIRVKVVPAGGFGQADVADIVHRVQQRLGQNVSVIVEPVTSIPRTKAGKFKAVISLIKENARTS